MSRLEGKVAIVTGGARGIGQAVVRSLTAEGARVVFGDVLVDEGAALAEELGPGVTFVRQDVTSTADWSNVVDVVTSAYGLPTVLVNNAGISGLGSIGDTSEELFKRVLDVNVFGVWLGIKQVAGAMRTAGGGSIINVSSVAGLVGLPNMGSYVSSKFAVRGLSKAMAIELAPSGIRVNSVHPGHVDTPLLRETAPGKTFKPGALKTAIPRPAAPAEIAQLIVYLASDESSFSTGSEFVADGGWTAV